MARLVLKSDVDEIPAFEHLRRRLGETGLVPVQDGNGEKAEKADDAGEKGDGGARPARRDHEAWAACAASAPALGERSSKARRAVAAMIEEAVSKASPRPDVSVVSPVFNEEGSVERLVMEIVAAFESHGLAFEVVIVDDASTDGTQARLCEIAEREPRLRALRHAVNAGQSRAVATGVAAARAPLVLTLDGDLQNDPKDGVALVDALLKAGEGVAMVAGERVGRRDPWAKRAASALANALRRRILRDGARDTGCGLKAFRREDFLGLPYFDHMHRFLPALMRGCGHDVLFMAVGDRPRTTGRSKYTNWRRFWVSIWDLMGVAWLIRRRRNPGAVTPIRPERTS